MLMRGGLERGSVPEPPEGQREPERPSPNDPLSMDEKEKRVEEFAKQMPEGYELPPIDVGTPPIVRETDEKPWEDGKVEVQLEDGTTVVLERPNPVLHLDRPTQGADAGSGTEGGDVDDNGNAYTDENGDYLPNNTFTIDGTVYKTDDHGQIYSADGQLFPNDTYELNGNVYTTDENGRIVDVQAKPTSDPDNTRDNKAQQNAGGEDRKEGDQGGDIVGRDMGGDGGEGNLVPMDSRINWSDYKKMENDIKRALDEGKDVTTHTEITYSGDSSRPDKIKVTVTVDGKETVYTFDNNLDGSLMDRVAEVGGKEAVESVQSVLDETGGTVSSIKEEKDENGNVIKVTVNITYTDENGKTQRTKVVVDDPKGGNEQ